MIPRLASTIAILTAMETVSLAEKAVLDFAHAQGLPVDYVTTSTMPRGWLFFHLSASTGRKLFRGSGGVWNMNYATVRAEVAERLIIEAAEHYKAK